MNDALKRALRTLAQLVVSGALTATVNDLVHHLTPTQALLALAGWQVVVTYAHNWLEDRGLIPAFGKGELVAGWREAVHLGPAGVVEFRNERAVAGRRLGWHQHHDPRSRGFAISAHPAFDPKAPISARSWKTAHHPLDQGELGSCTGNACIRMCQEMVGAVLHRGDEKHAVSLYKLATQLDGVPGQYPPDDTGSTTVGVLKAAQQRGYIGSYRWAFSAREFLWALSYLGPCIIGIDWYEGFDTPRPSGELVIAGNVRGGHELVVDAVVPDKLWDGGGYVEGWNSWGPSWGPLGGRYRISWATWLKLAAAGGEVGIGLS